MFLVVQVHESGVGQSILPSSMLKDVFDDAGAHNDTGIFMLSVSAKHPIFNFDQR